MSKFAFRSIALLMILSVGAVHSTAQDLPEPKSREAYSQKSSAFKSTSENSAQTKAMADENTANASDFFVTDRNFYICLRMGKTATEGFAWLVAPLGLPRHSYSGSFKLKKGDPGRLDLTLDSHWKQGIFAGGCRWYSSNQIAPNRKTWKISFDWYERSGGEVTLVHRGETDTIASIHKKELSEPSAVTIEKSATYKLTPRLLNKSLLFALPPGLVPRNEYKNNFLNAPTTVRGIPWILDEANFAMVHDESDQSGVMFILMKQDEKNPWSGTVWLIHHDFKHEKSEIELPTEEPKPSVSSRSSRSRSRSSSRTQRVAKPPATKRQEIVIAARGRFDATAQLPSDLFVVLSLPKLFIHESSDGKGEWKASEIHKTGMKLSFELEDGFVAKGGPGYPQMMFWIDEDGTPVRRTYNSGFLDLTTTEIEARECCSISPRETISILDFEESQLSPEEKGTFSHLLALLKNDPPPGFDNSGFNAR